MADSDLRLFGNLPRGKRLGYIADDENRFAIRETLGAFAPEGPLPPRPRPRPRPSGKGGSLYDKAVKPPVKGSVWSAADAAANGMTLSNGGLTVAAPDYASYKSIRGTISKTSGKLYVEFSNSVLGTDWQFIFGLANGSFQVTFLEAELRLGEASPRWVTGLGGSNYSCGFQIQTGTYVSSGFTGNYTSSLPDWLPAVGLVYGLAIDFAAGMIWISDNNVWSNGSNPATGTLPIVSFVPVTVGALFPAMSFVHGPSNGVWTLQATAASQKYAAPSGFTPWG